MNEIELVAWEKTMKETIPVLNIDFEKKMINIESAWRFFGEVELMQYTGLIDITGNKIYNRYILQDDEGFRWEVKFEQGAFMAECSALMAKQHLNTVNLWGKVVGNVYKNPELLEVK